MAFLPEMACNKGFAVLAVDAPTLKHVLAEVNLLSVHNL